MTWGRLFKRTLDEADWEDDGRGGRRATVVKWYHGGGAWYIVVDVSEDRNGRRTYFVRSENPDYEEEFDTRQAAESKAKELKNQTRAVF